MEKAEKIMDREIAWRIFAYEFNMSNLYVSEGDERAPNYIITPTGVKCNRLFIIGVVTEVENIGKDSNLWRARIADPTGVFTVYAGQYQPEAAIFLSGLEIPGYVALVGKARKYEPEDGSVYLSVRPEEINDSDEKQRDRWVLETAERTLERIKIIEEAESSGLSENELKEFLSKKVKNISIANGAMLAIKHYKNLDKILVELREILRSAIGTVRGDNGAEKPSKEPESIDEKHPEEKIQDIMSRPDTGQGKPGLEPKEVLASIIDELDTGKGTSFAMVIEAAQRAGIDVQKVELSLKMLMDEGRCYEPRIGMLRKV